MALRVDRNVRATLPEQVFEFDAAVSFLVAILDDDGGVNRESPFLGFSTGDGATARHDDGALRDDEAAIWAVSAIDCVFDGVEERGGAREDGSRTEHRAGAHLGAFVNAAIATDQGVVFDDYGGCIDRFEYAADLCRRTDVNILADLCAGADERMGVDQRAFVNIGSGIDVHGGHAHDGGGDKGATAYGRASGDDANPVFNAEFADREGVFVDEGEVFAAGFGELADSESKEDPLLDPDIDLPLAVDSFGGANLATRQRFAEINEDGACARYILGFRTKGEESFDTGLKWMHSPLSISSANQDLPCACIFC